MNNRKRNAITGITLGLVGFSILFCFGFEYFRFEYIFDSIFGIISIEIARIIEGDKHSDLLLEDTAIWFWYIFGVTYLILIWFYRTCIGYWFYKIINMFYKKI